MSEQFNMEKGIFIISVDLELAWGFNYELLKGSETALRYLKIIKDRSRRNVRKLLDLSERFNIPFTWGVVGHLSLSSCTRTADGVSHPDMPRPELDLNNDWYFNDPCSDVTIEPLWYGSDIIKQILESKVEHEIACHTFSHVDFSKCSKEVAMAEIRKCEEVMKDYGIELKSFIFPKNRIGNLDILKQEGFKTFRFKINRLYDIPASARAMHNVFSMIQDTLSPALGKPIKVNSLLAIPSSLLFQSSRTIDTLRLQFAVKRGVNKIVDKKEILHITMHDYLETDHLFDALSKILSYNARLRNEGKLDIKTMWQLYESQC